MVFPKSYFPNGIKRYRIPRYDKCVAENQTHMGKFLPKDIEVNENEKIRVPEKRQTLKREPRGRLSRFCNCYRRCFYGQE